MDCHEFPSIRSTAYSAPHDKVVYASRTQPRVLKYKNNKLANPEGDGFTQDLKTFRSRRRGYHSPIKFDKYVK